MVAKGPAAWWESCARVREGSWVEAATWSCLGQGVLDGVCTETPKCECVWHVHLCSRDQCGWNRDGATFRGAYGHSDGLGVYSTYNGKTIESLSCFFNETFQTYQKCTEPHFNT